MPRLHLDSTHRRPADLDLVDMRNSTNHEEPTVVVTTRLPVTIADRLRAGTGPEERLAVRLEGREHFSGAGCASARRRPDCPPRPASSSPAGRARRIRQPVQGTSAVTILLSAHPPSLVTGSRLQVLTIHIWSVPWCELRGIAALSKVIDSVSGLPDFVGSIP